MQEHVYIKTCINLQKSLKYKLQGSYQIVTAVTAELTGKGINEHLLIIVHKNGRKHKLKILINVKGANPRERGDGAQAGRQQLVAVQPTVQPSTQADQI